MNRVEWVLFVGIVTPLAWLLLWAWWVVCWIASGVVQVGSWAWQRWSRWREGRQLQVQRPVRHVRQKVAA